MKEKPNFLSESSRVYRILPWHDIITFSGSVSLLFFGLLPFKVYILTHVRQTKERLNDLAILNVLNELFFL